MHIVKYALENEYKIGVVFHFNVYNHVIDMDVLGVYGSSMQ